MRVLFAGDMRCSHRTFKELIEKAKVEEVVVLGDFVTSGYEGEYIKWKSFLDSFRGITFDMVIGNHDLPRSRFRKFFSNLNYYKDWDSVRLIVLDSGSGSLGGEQIEYAKKVIKDNSIVVFHHPPKLGNWSFHSLDSASTERFLSFVKDYDIKLLASIFGHIHGVGEKYEPDHFILSGGGGCGVNSFTKAGYFGLRHRGAGVVLDTKKLIFEWIYV